MNPAVVDMLRAGVDDIPKGRLRVLGGMAYVVSPSGPWVRVTGKFKAGLAQNKAQRRRMKKGKF